MVSEDKNNFLNWLTELSLLYGCPNNYLIPMERLLPPEFIRFFYINPNWILSLMDGACSIGRKIHEPQKADISKDSINVDFDYTDIDLDKIRINEIKQNTVRKSRLFNPEKKQDNPEYKKDTQDNNTNNYEGDEICTGFLLRSELVKNFTGMEIKTYGSDKTNKMEYELQVLRLDKLSNDILLGIYRGQITKLEMIQPPESLHFGIKSIINKDLKDIDSGKKLTSQEKKEILKGDENRTLNFSYLAEMLKGKPADILNSAEFAINMIESPAKCEIKL